MELVNFFKRILKNSKGITFVEIMVAVSILGICMTYFAVDSRYTSRAIYELNQKDAMLYAGQEIIERYKLDQTGGTKTANGYTIDVTVESDPALDPNLTDYLKKTTVTIHPAPNSGMSDIVLVSYVFTETMEAPAVPQNLIATASINGIVLNWDQAVRADTYNVKRSDTPGGPYITIATGVTTDTYTDATALNKVPYYYVVSASNTYGESGDSNEANSMVVIDTYTLTPIADSYIRGGNNSDNNYGSSTSLYFRYSWFSRNTYYTYIKFDLSGVSGTVVDAKLQLYGYNTSRSSGMNADIYNLSNINDDSWTEMGITWDNSPYEGSILGTMVFNGTAQYRELGVKNYCLTELSGNKLATFVVFTGSGDLGSIQSKEAAYKPQLVITTTPLPPPPAPQNLTASPGNKQVTLRWNTSIGAESYIVRRSTVSGGPYTTVQTNVTATSFVDTGLTNGTKYFYVVSAINGNGESGNSNEANATPNVITTMTYNPQADAYVRDGSYTNLNYGSSQTLDVKNALGGFGEKRTAYYKFDLSNLRGDIISAKLRLYGSNVENSNIVNIGCYEVMDNSWQEDSITNSNAPVIETELGTFTVDDFDAYRELDITNHVKSKMTSDKIINIATAGNGYTSRVSFNSRENSSNKPELIIEKTLLAPLPPDDLTAVPDDRKVTLTWSTSDETDSYVVKRSTTDGGPYTIIATDIVSTTFSDTSVINGTTYYYVVAAVNIVGQSANSEQDSATPNPTLTVNFNPTADAKVESYYPNNNYGTNTNFEVVNNGTNNKKSYLRFDLSGYTNNSIVSAKLRVYGSSTGALNIKAYKVSFNSWIESGAGGICWNNAPPLEDEIGSFSMDTTQQYYEVDITPYIATYVEASTLVSIGLYTDVSGAAASNINSREAVSGKPELVVKMVQGVPKQPKNLAGTGGNRFADLSWQAAEGATSYRIKRSRTTGGPYDIVASGVTATSYRNSGLTNGLDYYYTVSAVNSLGESVDSNEVCVVPSSSGSTLSFTPADDTYVRDGAYASSNYGGDATFRVSSSWFSNDGNNRSGFIKFDVTGASANPASARLLLTGQNITNRRSITINIYKVTSDSWDEHTLNWNNAPGNDILLGTITVDRRYATKSLDITSYVRSEILGDKKVSLVVKTSTASRVAEFGTKEGNDMPLLQLVY